MAAGDGHVFNNFKEQLLLKTIDCVGDTFKVALYSDAFDAGDIDGAAPAYSNTNEISVSGYTASGSTVGSKTVTQDDANNRAAWDAADQTWPSLATATIQQVILYDDSTATKWNCIAWEIGTNSNGGNYTLAFAATGMLLLS
jgi:hypothetical protein